MSSNKSKCHLSVQFNCFKVLKSFALLLHHIMNVPLTGRSARKNSYLFGSIIILHRLLEGLIRYRLKVNEQVVKISCLVQSFCENRAMILNKETKKKERNKKNLEKKKRNR